MQIKKISHYEKNYINKEKPYKKHKNLISPCTRDV